MGKISFFISDIRKMGLVLLYLAALVFLLLLEAAKTFFLFGFLIFWAVARRATIDK